MEFIIGAVFGLLLFAILGLLILGFKNDNSEYLFSGIVISIGILLLAALINDIRSDERLKEKCLEKGYKVIKIEQNNYCKL